jgi:hypothetical protein
VPAKQSDSPFTADVNHSPAIARGKYNATI